MNISEDVLDNYLVWELCKQQNIQKRILEGSSNGEELKDEIVVNIRQEYHKKDYNLSEKIELLRELDSNPEYRISVFKDCSWKKETINTDDLGTTLCPAPEIYLQK